MTRTQPRQRRPALRGVEPGGLGAAPGPPRGQASATARTAPDTATDPATGARTSSDEVVLSLCATALGFGMRTLWRDLDLEVGPGEFIAVLGANGSGKTSLLKAILGQQALQSGTITFAGGPVKNGDRRIGYIPQQRLIPAGTPLRGRDLVALGLTGHRFGPPWMSRTVRARVDEVLEDVGATRYAAQPVGSLSGGEQQRLRVAQALAGDPHLLLCDEPLLSLDLHHQHVVSELVDRRRREAGTPVLFVTHDINPILDKVTRVLYLAGDQHRIGTPAEVLRTEVLSSLYGTRVDVVRAAGRVIVVGTPDLHAPHHPEQAP